MAEGIGSSLMVKLGVTLATQVAIVGGSCITKEMSALRGLFSEIEDIKDELECMQSFVQVSERLRDFDEMMSTFVRKIRSLAFDTEDVVNEFTYKLGKDLGGAASRAIWRLRHIRTWLRLAFELRRIKASLKIAIEGMKYVQYRRN